MMIDMQETDYISFPVQPEFKKRIKQLFLDMDISSFKDGYFIIMRTGLEVLESTIKKEED